MHFGTQLLHEYATIPELPDKLSVVMRLLRQKSDLPPVKELMQGGERVLGDGTLV